MRALPHRAVAESRHKQQLRVGGMAHVASEEESWATVDKVHELRTALGQSLTSWPEHDDDFLRRVRAAKRLPCQLDPLTTLGFLVVCAFVPDCSAVAVVVCGFVCGCACMCVVVCDCGRVAARQFLKARAGDVSLAHDMVASYLKWRRSHTPNFPVTYSLDSIRNETSVGKCFFGPSDKLGRPCAIVCAKLHFKNKDSEETVRYIVYMLDQVCTARCAVSLPGHTA